MRWKTKYTPHPPNVGATRQKRVFAWLPHFIPHLGVYVWLGWYEVLQAFTVQQIKVEINGEPKIVEVRKWIDVSERI